MNVDAAWTDAILATASLAGAAYALRHDRQRWLTPAGLIVLGVAAAFGTLRFAGVDALIPAHEALSRLAGLVGLPLAAVGVAAASVKTADLRRLHLAAAICAVPLAVVAVAVDPEVSRAIRTVVSGAAMLAAIGFSAKNRNRWGALAPVLVLVAGLGLAGEGELAGFHRMGWFHLVMAPAAACFGLASTKTPEGPSE